VAIVSVVGAFRSGKSFLLSLFLRYLYQDSPPKGLSWLTAGGALREGNANLDASTNGAKFNKSFHWRGGQERTTMGIWMWSQPFLRKAADGSELYVLLMDTQGMFDNQSSLGLNACIFGLSALISSHQIYNVKARIQVSVLP
jgi:atlastin